jgi:hypothetical protein
VSQCSESIFGCLATADPQGTAAARCLRVVDVHWSVFFCGRKEAGNYFFSCTKNNQLRTGADKGNPTV